MKKEKKRKGKCSLICYILYIIFLVNIIFFNFYWLNKCSFFHLGGGGGMQVQFDLLYFLSDTLVKLLSRTIFLFRTIIHSFHFMMLCYFWREYIAFILFTILKPITFSNLFIYFSPRLFLLSLTALYANSF